MLFQAKQFGGERSEAPRIISQDAKGAAERTLLDPPHVIQDLKLPPHKHALAFAIVSHPNLVRTAGLTDTDLNGEMRSLLDEEEYENFAAAAARVSSRRVVIIN